MIQDAQVLKESKYPLLSRTRVTAKILYEGATPSRLVMRRKIAEVCKSKEDHVAIRHIFTGFGQREAKVIAHVYENADKMKILEEAHITKRVEKLAEKEKAASAKSEEKKE